jgi:hypothetical protein
MSDHEQIRMEELDAQFQEQVQDGMTALRAKCAEMRKLQADKEAAEETVKNINAQLDALRLRVIPEMMMSMEVKTATFPGIGRVQLAGDLHCSTVAGQKEAAMQWLRDCGYDDMISESYNATSMKALVRRLMEQGAEIPACLNVLPFTRASIVKG